MFSSAFSLVTQTKDLQGMLILNVPKVFQLTLTWGLSDLLSQLNIFSQVLYLF